MKCPDCDKEGARYNQKSKIIDKGRNKKNFIRTDFTAKHNCGWRGSL